MDFVLRSLLPIVTIMIGCIKYKRNAFADTILIDSSNERSTSLQSDDPVTMMMMMTLLKLRLFLLAFNGNKVILLNALINMIILIQNMKFQVF